MALSGGEAKVAGDLEQLVPSQSGSRERGMPAVVQLPFSTYEVQDPSQGTVPPTVGGSFHLNEETVPTSMSRRVIINSVKLTN